MSGEYVLVTGYSTSAELFFARYKGTNIEAYEEALEKL